MKIKSFLCAGIAALCCLSACNTTKESNPNKLEISGADGGLAFAATGGTQKVTVNSNVAWNASCEAEWVKVSPAEVTSTELTSTIVKVTASTNYAPAERSAVVTFAPTDETVTLSPVTLTVSQAAEAKNISVWNTEDFAPYENYSVNADYIRDSITLYIHANVNWEATTPDWVKISPASNTFDGENVNQEVKLYFETNTLAAENEGEIVLTGDGTTLTIPVIQAKSLSFTLENVTEEKHAYTDADITVTAEGGLEGKDHYWYYVCTTKAAYDKAGGDEAGGAEAYITSILTDYNANATDHELANLFFSETDKTLQFGGLPENTEYVLIIFGVHKNADKTFEANTTPATIHFTTTEAPVAEDAYLKFVGTYKANVYDYFASSKAGKDVRIDLNMAVEQEYINESYLVYYPDGNFSPVSGKYIDTFEAAYVSETKTLSLYNRQYGSFGLWPFTAGDFAIALTGGWWEDEESVIKSFDYVLSDDYTTLNLTNKSNVEGDGYYIQSLLIDENGEATDYAYAILVFDSESVLTRVEEETTESLAVKNLDTVKAKNDKRVLNSITSRINNRLK